MQIKLVEIEKEVKRIFQHEQATFDAKCKMIARLIYDNKLWDEKEQEPSTQN